MNKQEIEALFLELGNNQDKIRKYFQLNTDAKANLATSTNFLPIDSKISERLYCILNDIIAQVGCRMCGIPSKFITFEQGYRPYCKVCSKKSPEVIAKREATLLERYDVKNPSEIPSVKQLLSKQAKERYSDPLKKESIVNKMKNTCLTDYGEDNPAKVDFFKNKRKETNKERYGEEHYNKTDIGKQHLKDANLKIRGVDNPMKDTLVVAKNKESVFKNNGVDNGFKTEKSIANRLVSFTKNFGGYPLENLEIRKKGISTFYEKYNTKSYIESEEYKKYVKDKYDVDNVFQSPIIKEQSKLTSLLKFGVEHPMQCEENKQKTKDTSLLNWGVDNPAKHSLNKEKIIKGLWAYAFDRYFHSEKLRQLVIPLFTKDDYRGIDELYPFECVKCSTIFTTYIGGYKGGGSLPRCLVCNPFVSGFSSYEKDIVEWLKSLGINNIQENTRNILSPLELDIYLPDYNIAIEFNGLAFHSERGIYNKNKPHDYHIIKTNLCEEKGIRLIQIFEDEWIDSQDIVKSIIKNSLGITDRKIFARKCEVRNISPSECIDFLFENHLHTPITRKYNFGLFYNNELVYVLSLGKPRYNKNYQFEVVRSCCKINTNVIGGFSKLISYATKQLDIKSIISYVDRRYFTGSGYVGWNLLRQTPPTFNYVSSNYSRRINRENFQKQKLKALLPEQYDETLTEWEIMQLAGYDRIWDCGNLVFEYRV